MGTVRLIQRLALVLLIFTGGFAQASAQISPGKLAQPHAGLEGIANCTQCHEVGSGVRASKCLSCHQELAKRIEFGGGYHARLGEDCGGCHSDHNGRAFELIYWKEGKEKFDHALTGYPLQGRHAQLRCEQCHRPDYIKDEEVRKKRKDLERTFLGLDMACLACHIDEHRGQLDARCQRCHTQTAWQPAPLFSHNNTPFPLTGKHQTVPCNPCHPSHNDWPLRLAGKRDESFVQFKDLRFAGCADCHPDVHQGKFSNTCEQCHNTRGWQQIQITQFNHSETAFPLLGKHAQVACQQCHTSGRATHKVKHDRCADCHTDIHQGQFARRAGKGACESCHTEDGFVPARFDLADHARTRYPLTGAHQAVPCIACHTPVDTGTARERLRFTFTDLRCAACHTDVHLGQFASTVSKEGCKACHTTTAWEATRFDHDKTRFKLEGKHQTSPCRSCHKPVDVGTANKRLLFKPMPLDCTDCHADPHQEQFADSPDKTACQKCHTPVLWQDLLFVHDRDSRFRLEGAHSRVPCDQCHKPERLGADIVFIRYKPIDPSCATCHR